MDAKLLRALLKEKNLAIIIRKWMKFRPLFQRALSDYGNEYNHLYVYILSNWDPQKFADHVKAAIDSQGVPIQKMGNMMSGIRRTPEEQDYFNEILVLVDAGNQYLIQNKNYDLATLLLLRQVLNWYCLGADAPE